MKIKKWAFILLLCFAPLLFFNDLAFIALWFSASVRQERFAKPFAKHLRKTNRGLYLAAHDMSILRERTRGYSSWILRTTPKDREAVNLLTMIATNENETLRRRVGSYQILWDRTLNTNYFVSLFDLVQPASDDYATHIGRSLLIPWLLSDIEDPNGTFNWNHSKELGWSKEELLEHLNTPAFQEKLQHRENLGSKNFGSGIRNTLYK